MNNTNSDLKTFSSVLGSNDEEVSEKDKCRECGQDHSFRPTFEGVRTSIDQDVIDMLIEKLLRWEQGCNAEKLLAK
ncbi:MAG: hypothetical protein DLM72_13880 [Candidatus Nitrosopolaris wilkensis]|nr:MAG: hypothetical protein DLM72_13880 [Candidatus Nitrosopolaris wilkensis]